MSESAGQGKPFSGLLLPLDSPLIPWVIAGEALNRLPPSKAVSEAESALIVASFICDGPKRGRRAK